MGDSNHHILSLFTTPSSSLHIRKPLYLCNGAFHDFIVDTGNIKSIIAVGKLKSSDFSALNKTVDVYISSIIGDKIRILECFDLLIRGDKSSTITCQFLITNGGPSILGLDHIKCHQAQLPLLTCVDNSNKMPDKLFAGQSKCE